MSEMVYIQNVGKDKYFDLLKYFDKLSQDKKDYVYSMLINYAKEDENDSRESINKSGNIIYYSFKKGGDDLK